MDKTTNRTLALAGLAGAASIDNSPNMMPVSVAVDEHGNYVVLLRSCKR